MPVTTYLWTYSYVRKIDLYLYKLVGVSVTCNQNHSSLMQVYKISQKVIYKNKKK